MKEKKTTKNLGGRPTTLTEEISQAIIADVREFLSIAYSSDSQGQPRATVWSWIEHGNEDIKAGKDSLFSRFSIGIKKARSDFVKECVHFIKSGKNNWTANAWLLERCCAEEYGKDSELYKQLLEDYKMLMQSLVDQNKGVNHGRKIEE